MPGTHTAWLQNISFSFLDILQRFIFRKTRNGNQGFIMLCACVARSSATALMWGALATGEMGKMSSDLQSLLVDQRAAVTPPGNLQQRSGDPSEPLTPLRYTGPAQEAAPVWEISKRQVAAPLILVAVSLNHVGEVMLWKSCGSFMSVNPRRDIIDLTDFWRSC